MADTKEWTLMFYLGSDNALAPGIVSQLKSIKQAGFHQDVNVIAQFDPRVENTPAHIFDVNIVDKIKSPKPWKIGFGSEEFAESEDSSVPSLVTDKLWEEQANADLIKKSLGKLGVEYRPKKPSDCKRQSKFGNGASNGEPSPQVSLTTFLEFCRENYPAHHYILFLLGHGLVVGNDMFLFDEHAEQHSLSLSDLGGLLGDFKKELPDNQFFEVVSFHSCSMSALEVAYELKDTANYMLASQGPAFVGSWPYRQILMRIFYDLVKEEKDLEKTLKSIFKECLDNSQDFQLAGYSFDLCLCDLSKVGELRTSLAQLSSALSDGLKHSATRERILLAHWDAQSYWQESYTDIGDFCFCLTQRCNDLPEEGAVTAIRTACISVLRDLNSAVIKSEFAGPAYQYSHGLSVFYPWSMPENIKFWPADYRNYKLNKETKEAKEATWESFLTNYFDFTRRSPRGAEPVPKSKGVQAPRRPTLEQDLLETIGSRGFSRDGQLAIDKGDPNDRTDSPATTKGDPQDATGGESSGPSIKNYPPFTRPLPEKLKGKSASRPTYG